MLSFRYVESGKIVKVRFVKTSTQIEYFLTQITKKFSLVDKEIKVLTNYVSYMHEESKIKFLTKVLNNKKTYLAPFLDGCGVDDVEDELFDDMDVDEKYEYKLTKDDLNPVIRLELYTRLMTMLKSKPEDVASTYQTIGFDNSDVYVNVTLKRKTVYLKFVEWLNKLDDEELNAFFVKVKNVVI